MRILNLISLVFLLVLTSCKSDTEQIKMVSVNSSWKANEAKKIVMDVQDIQTPKNIIFVVRNNNEYPYSNIFLIADIQKEGSKKKQTDTVNYVMAESNGKWLGKGFGGTKEILFLYKTNYRFLEKGKYIFEIKQGMRKNPLLGIEDIGIKIESVKP